MIQINLFRVSANQEYLEFILDCPEDYRFNRLLLKQYDYIPTSELDSGWRDYSNIFDPLTDSSRVIFRIKIIDEASTFTNASIFYADFGVTYVGDGDEPVSDDGTLLSEQTFTAACSNVSWIYEHNLDLVLNMDVTNIKDLEYKTITRNFIYIQSHIEAMKLERFDEAERFYDLLKKIYNG